MYIEDVVHIYIKTELIQNKDKHLTGYLLKLYRIGGFYEKGSSVSDQFIHVYRNCDLHSFSKSLLQTKWNNTNADRDTWYAG